MDVSRPAPRRASPRSQVQHHRSPHDPGHAATRHQRLPIGCWDAEIPVFRNPSGHVFFESDGEKL